MLTCNASEELISEYLDQRLTDSQTSQMLQHCSQCPACRSFLNSLLELNASRARGVIPEVPAEVDSRIRSAIGRRSHANKRSRLFLLGTRSIPVPLPLAAALVLAALAAGIYLQLETRSAAEPGPAKHRAVTQIMSLPTITIENK